MTPQELAELDLAVARAENVPCCWNALEKWVSYIGKRGRDPFSTVTTKNGFIIYQPTRDGAEAMRLLEKYRLNLTYGWRGRKRVAVWLAGQDAEDGVEGPTPAIAICRAVVALAGKTQQDAVHRGRAPDLGAGQPPHETESVVQPHAAAGGKDKP